MGAPTTPPEYAARRPGADPAPASGRVAALAAAVGAGRARAAPACWSTCAPRRPGRPTRRPTSSAPAGRTGTSQTVGRPAARRRQRRPTTRSASTSSSTLRGLGLQTEVQDTVGAGGRAAQRGGRRGRLARVRNVVARLPGTASTGRVFLVAHYDSVQAGRAATTTAAGTSHPAGGGPRADRRPPAAQRRRASCSPTPRRRACAARRRSSASHPLAADGGVVLNLEARGSTGPVIMFETSPEQRRAGGRLRPGRPAPGGHLFAVEVYRVAAQRHRLHRLPRPGGFTGLNSAYIDGRRVYHTPAGHARRRWTGAACSTHGDNALGAGPGVRRRRPGRAARRGGDATYFPVLGRAGPLPRLAGLAAGRCWRCWRCWRPGLAGPAAPAGPAPAGWPPGSGWRWCRSWPRRSPPNCSGLVVTALRPGYAELLDPYRPVWYRLAVVALAAAILLAWYALMRRRLGPAALAVGGLGWLALLGVRAGRGGARWGVPGHAAGAGRRARRAGRAAYPDDGPWPVVAVTAGRRRSRW